ncbi:MAG TPA: hypothetical protein DCX46_00180 [Bacteroidetes bacterium]|nr:hypothetical protein [Bacteroidota bacterium]
MMKRSFLLVLSILLASLPAFALPRFASRNNFACAGCHVNPSGGGMRNTFGLTFGREDVPMKSWQEEYGLADFSTQINDFISYGLDFRFLAFYQKKNNPDTERSSFFPMQADVYFNLAVSKKIHLIVNPAFGPFNRYEVFGVAKVLPWSGYVKLGRFTPPYGLRLDDHTSYVRDVTPFRNNSGQQAGIEVGFNPGWFSLAGALTNGVAGDRDGDLAKAAFGRAEARFSVGPANLMIGAASYNDVSGGEKYNMLGAFGAVTLFEQLSVIGDAEWVKGNSGFMGISSDRLQRNAENKQMKQFALLIEANYAFAQGIDLKFAYDFFDPNTDLKSGSTSRYSGGFEFFPFSGVEVRPLYRISKDNILKRDITDIHILFHLYL